MDNREQELTKLKEYIDSVDKETTFLLQNLQWDHKHLLESPVMVSCKYVAEHRVPLRSVEDHEKQCFLRQEGYCKEDILLPDSIDPNAKTVIKFGKQDIMKIINTAASLDPTFKRGSGATEPLSAARLQLAYSADERRAIHDAVVAATPACSDLPDLDMPSSSGAGGQASKAKGRAEVLAELRDMKRRRAKYRVAANTANYSHVLRGLIKSQMELYAEAKGIFIKTEYGAKTYVSLNNSAESGDNSTDIIIKQERPSPVPEDHRTGSRRHRERSRSADRRRDRREEENRHLPVKRRDHTDGNSSDNRKYDPQDMRDNSKERRIKRDIYYNTKEAISKEGSNRHGNDNREQGSFSKYGGRRNEDDRKLYKRNNRDYYESPKNSSEYSNSKEHKHRSYRDDSKNSKSDNRRKYDEYGQNRNDRHREEKCTRYYDNRTEIKEEKLDYYEDSNDDKRKGRRH